MATNTSWIRTSHGVIGISRYLFMQEICQDYFDYFLYAMLLGFHILKNFDATLKLVSVHPACFVCYGRGDDMFVNVTRLVVLSFDPVLIYLTL